MSFSETKFAEAVELLHQLDVGGSKREKRRAKRAMFRVQVGIKEDLSDPSGAWEKCQLRDLSPRGMSLLVQHDLDQSDSFAVQFPDDPSGITPSPLICRVAYSVRQRDGTYLIGAEFTGRLTPPSTLTSADENRIRKSSLG
jgi:hypothetical protein